MPIITDYRKIYQEAAAKAKASGKLIRRTFNKQAFAEQFPAALQDPRFQLLPDDFVLDLTPLEGISVRELREICKDKPDHPLAIAKRMSIITFSEDQVVYILREDLDILRQGNTPTTETVPGNSPPADSSPDTEPAKAVTKEKQKIPAKGILEKKDADPAK